MICPNCKHQQSGWGVKPPKFCQRCGARMKPVPPRRK